MSARTGTVVAASAATALGLATSAAATTEAAGSHPQPAYQGAIDSAIGPPTVRPIGDAAVAALQVALHACRLRPGPIDSLMGPQTIGAIRRLQRRAKLPVDGVVGPGTRAALGRLGRHPLGSRVLAPGAVGWAGLPEDGRAGPSTLAALRAAPAVSPITLAWPLLTRLGDPFGPRGARFHSAIDPLTALR